MSVGLRARLSSIFFNIALTVETALAVFEMSDAPYSSMSLIFRGTFILVLMSLAFRTRGIKEWVGIAAVLLFGFFCYRQTGRNEILRFSAFAMAAGGEDLKRVLKLEFFETLFGTLVIILFSVTGMYGGISLTADYRMNGVVETRYTLGFGHPNALHCIFLMLLLLGIAIWFENLRVWHFVVFIVADACVYLLTDSRTGVVTAGLGIVLAALLKLLDLGEKKGGRYLRNFCAGTMTAIHTAGAGVILSGVIFSVWAARWSAHSRVWWYVYESVDHLLNGRIAELYFGAEERGSLDVWSLFSHRGAERFFDMGFVRLYYWYGIIPATMAVGFLVLTVWLALRNREAGVFAMLVTMAVYTVFEAHLVSVFIGRNYLLPVMGVWIYDILWKRDNGNAGLQA